MDSAAPDNGVGVTWQLDNLGPAETRAIEVRWLLAAPAPPGTISPPPPPDSEGFAPDAEGVIHAINGVIPPPVAGKSVNIKLSRGRVCFTPPRVKRCIPLTDPVQIPVGSKIDTRRGRVTLISAANNRGGVQDAWFYEGIFRVSQTRGSAPITELAMAETLARCPRAKRSASAAQKKPKTRKLWGDGKGKFRTRGQFSSATVRGTKWVVIDRCDGTLTRVVRGSVTVRDTVRKRTVIVRAGKQYLARKAK